MTARPAPRPIERVSIVNETPGYVAVPRRDRREFVDAPEPWIAYGLDRRPWRRRVSPYVRLR
jgi:hypothetical protein